MSQIQTPMIQGQPALSKHSSRANHNDSGGIMRVQLPGIPVPFRIQIGKWDEVSAMLLNHKCRQFWAPSH